MYDGDDDISENADNDFDIHIDLCHFQLQTGC